MSAKVTIQSTPEQDLRQIQKQIHFFLLAFRADATAFSVCCRL